MYRGGESDLLVLIEMIEEGGDAVKCMLFFALYFDIKLYFNLCYATEVGDAF